MKCFPPDGGATQINMLMRALAPALRRPFTWYTSHVKHKAMHIPERTVYQ